MAKLIWVFAIVFTNINGISAKPQSHLRTRFKMQRDPINNMYQALLPCSIALFPLPKTITCGPKNSTAFLSPSFHIQFANGSKSTQTVLLQKALDRTLQHISHLPRVISREGRAEPGLTGSLRSVNNPKVTSHKIALAKLIVYVASEDDGQGKMLQTDESYMLSVAVINSTTAVAKLEAHNVYGALYGLTTFTQLFRIFGWCGDVCDKFRCQNFFTYIFCVTKSSTS